MKKLLLAALVALTFSACQTDRASESSSDVADSASGTLVGTTYGEALTLTEVTPVSLILDNPNDFVGETVLVEGMVVEVCENKGCWLDIASDRDYEKIQVKVDDGVGH